MRPERKMIGVSSVPAKKANAPQDITAFVMIGGVIAGVIAAWFGYPMVPVFWLAIVIAVWMMQAPVLTGKKDSYGYPAPANSAEERKLARYSAGTSLRASLFFPASDVLPGRPLRAAWVSSIAVAGIAYLIPVDGNKHLAASTGRILDAVFAFVLVASLTGALRRSKGADNPGIRFDTWRGYFRTHPVLAFFAPPVGALIGGAIAFALLDVDARYGSSFGAKSIAPAGLLHPGLFFSNSSLVLVAFSVAGAWFALLVSWKRAATAGFVEVTNARAQWKYRWTSLKFDPCPVLVDHEVLGDGTITVDTFDAPAHLGAIEFLKNESRLAPLVGPGERIALLSSPEEGPLGSIPGARSAIRFRAVTWSAPYDVKAPGAVSELVALWTQSALAWVSHGRGVPFEPLPNEIVSAVSPNGAVGNADTKTPRASITEALVKFWRRVKESSPTTSTLEAALSAENDAQDEPLVSEQEQLVSDEETSVPDGVSAPPQLWRTTWFYTDDTIGPQVFRDNALSEIASSLRAPVLIDHRDGGTIYVGDLDCEDITDETTEKALIKVRTEDLWRQIWTSSVKSGANLPIPEVSTHAERRLANGSVVHRMAFKLNLGNEPLHYKYPGVEGKLKSALGLGRTSGATFVAVTGYPASNNGGRTGERHPQAIYVMWSFDKVPTTPTALAASSPADQWILAGIVNDAFSNVKLAHPEIVSVRCLTKPSASTHTWEIQLRLYGGVTTGDVRTVSGKIADNLATPWVRVTDAPDGCVIYLGDAPNYAELQAPADEELVASLDWEQAFLVSHVVGSVGSVPTLVNTSHLPSNEDVQVLEFELPPGLDKTAIKIAASKLRTATGNAYLSVLDSEHGPTFVTIQACEKNPLPDMVSFDFAAADRSDGIAFATGVDGEPEEFIPRRDVHLAVIGMSGSGKSVTAQALLYGAAIKGYEIFVIDPMKGAADFKFLEPYARAMSTNIHDAAATLKAIYAEVERRKDLNARYGAASIADLPDDVRPAPIFVFVDEFTSLITAERVPRQAFDDPVLEAERQQQLRISSDRTAIAYSTGKLARESRSAGVSLCLGTQKLMADSLKDVPGGGDLKTNLSRLLLGQTSLGERMSALRAFDQAPDPGEVVPAGRGIWESSVKTGVLIQAWYAPAAVLGEQLAKRVAPLAPSERLDVTPFLSRSVEQYGVIDEEDEVIDLGEVSISLDDLIATGATEEYEPVAEAALDDALSDEEPGPWIIDWGTRDTQPDPTSDEADDDPFPLPAKKAAPIIEDPFA